MTGQPAGPAVVALGGGHGLSASLTALRTVTERLTAVVTVADDGGSSGRLRRELGVLPPGDLRMALAALCGDDEWGRTWARVLQHRFAGDGELHDHATGNLLIVALWELLGEHVQGLDWVARLLGAQGRVLPMAAVPLDIEALVGLPRPDSGPRETTVVRGQHAVATVDGPVVAVSLVPTDPPACPEAVAAIADADWIVLGPGSWFSSVIPHLLVPGLREALVETRAKRIVTLNLSTEGGETDDFTPEMHLEVLAAYAPDFAVDIVLVDSHTVIDLAVLDRVAATFGAKVLVRDVSVGDGTPRHSPPLLARAYAEAFEHGSISAWQ